jgi:hypothetical protein
MTILFNDDENHHGQIPADRRIVNGRTFNKPYERVDFDPFRSYKVAWYKRPDAIIEVFCAIGIVAVIAAIYFGWLP